MITLHTSLVSDNIGLSDEDIQVKSVSAAWNRIREIRDTTDPQILNGVELRITQDEPSDRLPNTIRFTLNSKGKIEFKDAAKVKKVEAELTGGKITFINPETGKTKEVQCVDPSTFPKPKAAEVR